jgi:hypothetical protein
VQKGLLKKYGKQEPGIFCLTANKIKARVTKETYAEKEKQYSIKIKAEVNISDFMEAEIENQVLEKEESDLPWKEEMEQDVLGPSLLAESYQGPIAISERIRQGLPLFI